AADFSPRVNAYFDSRGMPTTSLTLSASKLPLKTDFFGFIDAYGGEKAKGLESVYGEFKLSRKVFGDIGVAVEHNQDFLKPFGVTRLGLSYEPRIVKDGFVGMTLYPFATEHDGAQVVLYGRKNFREGKYYVEGFFDYNFKPGTIVSELQLGRRLYKKLYGVVEVRHNGFMGKRARGVGLGLEWNF
ncbi:MAG: hypothetical protein AABY00_01645, partial [Nanoarchaeota archaeon]